jgi:hypothetical protein
MVQTPYPPSSAEAARLKHGGLEPQSTFTHPTEDMGPPLAEPNRGLGEGVRVVTGNFKRALDRSLDDDPMATLATAAIVGFVLGAIWKA